MRPSVFKPLEIPLVNKESKNDLEPPNSSVANDSKKLIGQSCVLGVIGVRLEHIDGYSFPSLTIYNVETQELYFNMAVISKESVLKLSSAIKNTNANQIVEALLLNVPGKSGYLAALFIANRNLLDRSIVKKIEDSIKAFDDALKKFNETPRGYELTNNARDDKPTGPKRYKP